jgi:hypothetical protein
MLVPSAATQHDPHDREHDRNLDQNSHDGRQRRPRLKSEQCDRRSDGELEEIRGADQRRRTRDIVRHAERPVEQVSDAGM